jgi:ABC-type antimicrobial peptide transport system permease subunit
VGRIFLVARRTAFMYSSIGCFGIFVAVLGLAGVTAFTVVQRTKEIGIRIAIGATRVGILLLVTKEVIVLLIIGTLLGEAAAFALTRLLGSSFYGLATVTNTGASEPLLVLGAPLLLGFLTMVVSVVPARRSLSINPVSALRAE